MKANELRIGNHIYVYPNMKLQTVIDVLCDGVNTFDSECVSYDHILGIPLTEEWLLRFRFEKNNNNQFILMKGSVDILFNKDLNSWTCDGINFSINMTEHVHQLQNLYFALTGEELTFKSE
jgi:hypothetical protein